MEEVTLYKCLFGSRLFGIHSPESDYDYKEIFLPSRDDILLGRTVLTSREQTIITDVSGKEKQIDIERMSLQKFMEGIKVGEHNAVSILFSFTNSDAIIESNPRWSGVTSVRSQLVSKNIRKSLGFMNDQINKYSNRGLKVSVLKDFLKISKDFDDKKIMLRYKDEINLFVSSDDSGLSSLSTDSDNVTHLEICGKKYPLTAKVSGAKELFNKEFSIYSERAKEASENQENVDWKGVSHCLRVSSEVLQILSSGEVKFPSKDADFLKSVKDGEFELSEVLPKIEKAFQACENSSRSSNLRKMVDGDFVDDLVKRMHFSQMQ